MRKTLFAVIGCFTVFCAHAAQIVNVDYIHKLIAQEWDISIPIKADSPMHVANMKYLLTAVDVANEILNGEKTTDYGNGEFATTQVADTVATNQAVDTLIEKEEKYKFSLTINQTHYQSVKKTTDFKFSIGAAGTFSVDWGDGTEETIVKNNTDLVTYSHDYKTTDAVYTIRLGGKATEYSENFTSIRFSDLFYDEVDDSEDCSYAHAIESIDGSLGKIFKTLPNNAVKQPRFNTTFWGGVPESGGYGCYAKITSIPAGLFAGISGAPASYMFLGTFSDCRNLTSIPAGLFAGISGAPAEDMFYNTFLGCSGLTSIPDGLFAGISGAPAYGMFDSAFKYCSGLTSIPDNLFAGISGAPEPAMFYSTFEDCSGLISIPENLFGNISGTAKAMMFERTFYNCRSLTGPSARINGQYLYEIWPDATTQFGDMYYRATGLSDYSNIPAAWK